MTVRRSLLRAAFTRAEPPDGRHLTAADLMALDDPALDVSARESLLDHVSLCEPCADCLLDHRSRGAPAEEEDLADWSAVAAAIQQRPRAGMNRLQRFDPARWAAPLIRLAVAAPAAASIVLAAVLLWRAADTPDAPRTASSASVAQRQAPGPDVAPRTQDPRFAGTGALVLEELVPAEAVRGPAGDVQTIRLDRSVPLFAVVLHTTDQRTFPSYRIVIEAADGSVAWQGDAIRTLHGTFVLGLPTGSFEEAPYRIRLTGEQPAGPVSLGIYRIHVTFRSSGPAGSPR